MQQTETYKLNLIEGSDAFSPQPMNDNMEVIEGALEALAGGQLHIAAGSYTGTGTYGEDTPNSLTFDFQPKVVIIDTAVYNHFAACPYIWGSASLAVVHAYTTTGSVSAYLSGENVVTLNGNTMTWYCPANVLSAVDIQLNVKGNVYRYVAIG
ncbi:MAG: hypothetical protein ACI4OU_04310 [Candidatus Enterenecus sp.]